VTLGDEPSEHFRVSCERSEVRGQKYILRMLFLLLHGITKLGDRRLAQSRATLFGVFGK